MSAEEDLYEDFDSWIEDNFDLHSDFDDILSVYRTLSGDSGYGYTLTNDNGRVRLSSDYGLYAPVEVPSDKVDEICRKMDELYGWPIDAEESFRHAMEKND